MVSGGRVLGYPARVLVVMDREIVVTDLHT